jgi:hypothetical protein
MIIEKLPLRFIDVIQFHLIAQPNSFSPMPQFVLAVAPEDHPVDESRGGGSE